jgi:hypothetical protein
MTKGMAKAVPFVLQEILVNPSSLLKMPQLSQSIPDKKSKNLAYLPHPIRYPLISTEISDHPLPRHPKSPPGINTLAIQGP